jgi:hypothetical protein
MNTLSSLLEFIGNRIAVYDARVGVVQVSKSSVSSLPTTITDEAIKSDQVAIEATLSNPAAQKSNWTVTTQNGSLTIAGTISGTTNITILLASKVN